MHITSYIAAHMIYQALLCLLQTGITIYILGIVGVSFPNHSLVTGSFLSEFAISLFLITYAADMMALWISALCRSSTTAMTVMPVILIFQLVCSGGLISLPLRMEPVKDYVISNVGLRLIATEADYNHLRMTSVWSTVSQMKNNEIQGSFTVGDLADKLQESDNPTVQKLRAIEIWKGNTVFSRLTVGDVADHMTADNPDMEGTREEEIKYNTTVGDLLNIVGEERVRDYVVESTSLAAQKPEYEYNGINLAVYWIDLVILVFIFALFATVTLELIDKDKR